MTDKVENIPVVTRTVTRLDAEVYQKLEQMLVSDIYVSKETTDIQAGYLLGIQKVLRELRNGFTVGF